MGLLVYGRFEISEKPNTVDAIVLMRVREMGAASVLPQTMLRHLISVEATTRCCLQVTHTDTLLCAE
jgi:hypothetical protein